MKFICDNCGKEANCIPVNIDGFTYCYCAECKQIVLNKFRLNRFFKKKELNKNI